MKILTALLWMVLFSPLDAYAANCDVLMAALLRLDAVSPQRGFSYGWDDSVLSPLEKVVNRRRQAGEFVPDLSLSDDAKMSHRALTEKLDQISQWEIARRHRSAPAFGSAENPIPLKQIGNDSAPVYLVEIGGKAKIFRPGAAENLPGSNVTNRISPTSTAAARRTVAASLIDAELKVDVVTPSSVARVNGVVGSLSDFVPGAKEVGVIQPQMYFSPEKEANWSNVKAVEFLLGNAWSHGHNQLRDPKLHTWAIDFDQAFIQGAPRSIAKPKKVTLLEEMGGDKDAWLRDRAQKISLQEEAFPFGRALPTSYSPEFADGLKSYSPEKIRQSLAPHLQPEEIEGVIFRREIILADMEEKGAKGLLQKSGRALTDARDVNPSDSYPFAEIWPQVNPFMQANGVTKSELDSLARTLAGRGTKARLSPKAEKLLAEFSPEDARHFALEYLFQTSGLARSKAPLRASLIRDLGNSPRSTGRTVELLLEASRGSSVAVDSETKLAAEAIRDITSRIGSYPPRFEAAVSPADVKKSLLEQPIETIDAMLPKTNVYRVKMKNGVRGVLKPRMEDRPWGRGLFETRRIAYSRELEAKSLLDTFMGNEASREAGLSRIWIPETVEVSPVIKGRAFGPSSFQAFAEGYVPLDDFIKQNPDVWRVLVRSPEWKETKARIKVLDYVQGNLDRLGNKANTASFLRKLNLANIMVPKDLRAPKDLKVALIDNAIGRPGLPLFTIDFAPKADEIPEDLKKALKDFDFDGYRKSARPYLSAEGAEDAIRRVKELQALVGAGN